MEYLILPLTKGPHTTGRVGAIDKQDWFNGLVKAKELLAQFPNSKILVLSNVQVAGEVHEAELYYWALKQIGVYDRDILIVRKAQETIEQIAIAREVAKKEGARLVVISTWLHYPRVRWLMSGMGAEHHVAFGIPRPREAVTDIVLTFLFPLLDLFGKREWFMQKVNERRLSGKH